MVKSIKDWTLAEAKEYCANGNKFCDECLLVNGICTVHNPIPRNWEIEDCPRFTAQEVQEAKNILRILSVSENADIKRGKIDGYPGSFLVVTEGYKRTIINPNLFPSIREDETFKLSDIVGYKENGN